MLTVLISRACNQCSKTRKGGRKERRRRKGRWAGIRSEKEETKLVLFRDDINVYIENSKSFRQIIIVNKLSKIAGYKVNTQNSITLRFISLKENIISQMIPVTRAK